ncbi:MAG: TIGR00180 family glycosyltransferase [Paucibacter sp.]|nr:TIGR00180 family glycosyltransferase [Roseateles sp.]
MNDVCTIAIPTHNRQDYFERLFRYYSEWPIQLLLIDSSESSYQGGIPLNFNYLHCPGSDFIRKICLATECVQTPYIALSADDDFLLLKGFEASIHSMQKTGAAICTGEIEKFFADEFENYIHYSAAKSHDLSYPSGNNSVRFLAEYQLILWSVFKLDLLKNVFNLLNTARPFNNNFIELVIAHVGQEEGGVIIKNLPVLRREITRSVLSWGQQTPPLYFMDPEQFEYELAKLQRLISERFSLYGFDKDVHSYISNFRPRFCGFRKILFFSKLWRYTKMIYSRSEVSGMPRKPWY